MNLELCKRVITLIVHPNGQSELQKLYHGLNVEPYAVGLGALQSFVSEQGDKTNSESARAMGTQAFIAGICFAYSTSTPQVKDIMEEFFRQDSLRKGENIVNFGDFLARKG